MRVPAAKSSGDWVQPCSMTIRGTGCPAVAARHVKLVGTAPRLVAEGGCQELRAIRHGDGRRSARRASWSAAWHLEADVADRTEKAAQPLGHRRVHRFPVQCRRTAGQRRRRTSAQPEVRSWPPSSRPFRPLRRWSGPCRVREYALPGATWPPSMRCSAAVASVSRPTLVRRVAASRSVGRAIFICRLSVMGKPVRHPRSDPGSASVVVDRLDRRSRRSGRCGVALRRSVSSVGQSRLDLGAGVQRTQHRHRGDRRHGPTRVSRPGQCGPAPVR